MRARAAPAACGGGGARPPAWPLKIASSPPALCCQRPLPLCLARCTLFLLPLSPTALHAVPAPPCLLACRALVPAQPCNPPSSESDTSSARQCPLACQQFWQRVTPARRHSRAHRRHIAAALSCGRGARRRTCRTAAPRVGADSEIEERGARKHEKEISGSRDSQGKRACRAAVDVLATFHSK